MRRADPNELTTAAVPILTARISEAELAEWVPVPFDLIEDPNQTPEPSLGALVALDGGEYVVLYYGRISGQLTVEISGTADPSTVVDAFFEEIPLPPGRVLWHRPDVHPNVLARAERDRERGARILIVEGDWAIRTLLVSAFRKCDFFSDSVGSAPEALEMLARHSYDVMLLDMSFPPAVLRHVMQFLENMPQERPIVFAVSNNIRDVDGLDSRLVTGIIRKPFDVEELQHVISVCLEQRAGADERIHTPVKSAQTLQRAFRRWRP